RGTVTGWNTKAQLKHPASKKADWHSVERVYCSSIHFALLLGGGSNDLFKKTILTGSRTGGCGRVGNSYDHHEFACGTVQHGRLGGQAGGLVATERHDWYDCREFGEWRRN